MNPVIRATRAVGGSTPTSPPATERPTLFLLVNLAAHLAIVLAAVTMSRSRARLRHYRAVVAAAVTYGAAAIASTYMSVPDLASALVLQTAVIPLTILSASVCLPAIFEVDDYDVLFVGVIVVLTAVAIASLWLVATGSTSVFGWPLLKADTRGGALAAAGLFSHRNTIGSFLEFGPALTVYLMTRTTPRVRRLYWVALALICAHLVLTFSRSSQAAAVISLLPLLWPARARARVFAGVAAGALALASVVVATVPEFREHVALGLSLRRRQDIWRSVLGQALERPWFGAGLKNVAYVAHGFRYGPHNLFLGQLAYFGAVGLALFLGVLATAGRLIVYRLRSEQGWRPWLFAMLIVGVLLQGMVEYILTTPIFFSNSLFWICVGFASRPRGAGTY